MKEKEALDKAIELIQNKIEEKNELKDEDISMCFFQVGSDMTCEECGECFRANRNWEQELNEEIKELEEAKDILKRIAEYRRSK